jgi:LysR family transcriptional regulator, transcriptional activator of nhaA
VLNYNHLYYFYVSAKLSGVTAAARQLHTSQPSMSAQIKNLELALDKKLFRKNGRQMELTDDGQQVYSYCQRMFEIAEDLEGFAKGKDSLMRPKLTIGVSPEVEGPYIANAICNALKKNKTRPVVSMLSHAEADLRKDLKLGRIDFLISDTAIDDRDLEVKATIALPVVFFISAELADELKIKCNETAVDAIKKAANCLALGTPNLRLRQETDQYLQKKKICFNLVYESDILDSITRTVIDGTAAGVLPLPYILKEARRGLVKIISPPEGLWQHKIYVVTNRHLASHFFLADVLAVLTA